MSHASVLLEELRSIDEGVFVDAMLNILGLIVKRQRLDNWELGFLQHWVDKYEGKGPTPADVKQLIATLERNKTKHRKLITFLTKVTTILTGSGLFTAASLGLVSASVPIAFVAVSIVLSSFIKESIIKATWKPSIQIEKVIGPNIEYGLSATVLDKLSKVTI